MLMKKLQYSNALSTNSDFKPMEFDAVNCQHKDKIAKLPSHSLQLYSKLYTHLFSYHKVWS